MTVAIATRVEELQSRLDRITNAVGVERVPGISMCILDGDQIHEVVSGVASLSNSFPIL